MRLFLITLAVALTIAACSGSDDQSGDAPTTVPTTTTTPETTTPETTTTPDSTTSSPSTTATTPAEGEPVTFVTSDGVTLEGRRFGSGETGVVLAHMRPAEMDSWFGFAEVLADAGYSALAFNFRGYGESDGGGFAVDIDTVAAIDFLESTGVGGVVVIGASMGGTGAVAAAAERSMSGAITLSAPDVFEGTDAVAAAATFAGPLLLMAAEDDQPYPEDAAAIAGAAAGGAQVAILPGRAHGTDLLEEHEAVVTTFILEFLELKI